MAEGKEYVEGVIMIPNYVPREVSKKQAREEIRQLFTGGRTLYYSDIAIELQLSLELVVEICSELMKKGEIGLDEGAIKRRRN